MPLCRGRGSNSLSPLLPVSDRQHPGYVLHWYAGVITSPHKYSDQFNNCSTCYNDADKDQYLINFLFCSLFHLDKFLAFARRARVPAMFKHLSRIAEPLAVLPIRYFLALDRSIRDECKQSGLTAYNRGGLLFAECEP